MKISQAKKNGFTLVEMLVVVTLIAIIATIAIALMSGASRDSAETVNASNIRHLTSNMGAYMQLHSGSLPDKLDSLLDSTKIANASYTTLTTGVYVVDNPGTVLYIGKDTDRDGVIDSTSYTSKGLDAVAWSDPNFRTLTVSQLTSNDVSYLASIGITTVYDTKPQNDGNLFHGADNYTSRSLVVGDPVVTVDPSTTKNAQLIYYDLGFHDIYNTTNYPISGSSLTTVGRTAAMAAARYLVFGIGRYCTMIGDRKAGLEEAPICPSPVVSAGVYNRYLVVVKIAAGPNDMTTDFAGILDPRGNNARSAESWATRTGN